MRILFLLITLFLAVAQAEYGPLNQKSLCVGNRCWYGTDVDNMIILHGSVDASSRYTTLRRGNDTTGYAATGTTLKCYGMEVFGASGQVTSGKMLYGDTIVTNDPTGPTNQIYLAGLSSTIYQGTGLTFNPGAGGGYSQPNVGRFSFYFEVPVGKYPAVQLMNGTGWAIVYCKY
jgi:hypothetical protein